jgi:hypothetical protein
MSALRVIHRSFRKHQDTNCGRPTGSVPIVTLGGLEHGGGIGRQALVRVIDDESLRRRLAKGARDRLVNEFDVRNYAPRPRHLHASLLAFGRNELEAIKERVSTVAHQIAPRQNSQTHSVPRVNSNRIVTHFARAAR